MPQKRGKTMKRKSKSVKKSRVLTIPELRSSLKHISDYATSMVHSGKVSAKQFANEWKRVFGKTISLKAADSYIKSMSKLVKKGRFTRKQRGGENLLSGSPILALTRPGVDLPYVRSDLPPYVDKGFVNPEPGILQDCGKQTGILPQAGMGSNAVMKGGGLFGDLGTSVSAAMYRPFVGQNPTSPQHNLMTTWKGMPPPPGPESWQKTWQPHSNGSETPIPMFNIYNRDLIQSIRT
jgi:hypothetical protein